MRKCVGAAFQPRQLCNCAEAGLVVQVRGAAFRPRQLHNCAEAGLVVQVCGGCFPAQVVAQLRGGWFSCASAWGLLYLHYLRNCMWAELCNCAGLHSRRAQLHRNCFRCVSSCETASESISKRKLLRNTTSTILSHGSTAFFLLIHTLKQKNTSATKGTHRWLVD